MLRFLIWVTRGIVVTLKQKTLDSKFSFGLEDFVIS